MASRQIRASCAWPSHREAIASLLYGITSGRGFMALIAEPGMGKTTLLFELLRSLGNSATSVFLFQTQCNPEDFLRSILADLGVNHRGANLAEMQARLNEAVLNEAAAGKRLVVAIDEAQNLATPVLELLRMLSNFETPREKLMQIILTGQPQLATKLSSPDLIQLRQRISIFGRLKNLSAAEINQYIDHRLRVAGYDSRTPLFTERARAMIARYSRGIPRNINNICFNALSLACALKKKTVNCSIIEEVLSDLDLGSLEAQAPSPLDTSQERIPKELPAASFPAPARQFTWALKLGAVAAVLALALPFLYAGQERWKVPASWLSVFESSAKQVSVAPSGGPGKCWRLEFAGVCREFRNRRSAVRTAVNNSDALCKFNDARASNRLRSLDPRPGGQLRNAYGSEFECSSAAFLFDARAYGDGHQSRLLRSGRLRRKKPFKKRYRRQSPFR